MNNKKRTITKGMIRKKLITVFAGNKVKCSLPSMMAILYTLLFIYTDVYAVDTVTKPLQSLKTLVISIIGAIGVIIIAKNVMEFAQAYQSTDTATMNSALKGIVAGVMMAGISTILTFLGF